MSNTQKLITNISKQKQNLRIAYGELINHFIKDYLYSYDKAFIKGIDFYYRFITYIANKFDFKIKPAELYEIMHSLGYQKKQKINNGSCYIGFSDTPPVDCIGQVNRVLEYIKNNMYVYYSASVAVRDMYSVINQLYPCISDRQCCIIMSMIGLKKKTLTNEGYSFLGISKTPRRTDRIIISANKDDVKELLPESLYKHYLQITARDSVINSNGDTEHVEDQF